MITVGITKYILRVMREIEKGKKVIVHFNPTPKPIAIALRNMTHEAEQHILDLSQKYKPMISFQTMFSTALFAATRSISLAT
jgi:hypothetical protein